MRIDSSKSPQQLRIGNDGESFVAYRLLHEVPVHEAQSWFVRSFVTLDSTGSFTDNSTEGERGIDDSVSFRPSSESHAAEQRRVGGELRPDRSEHLLGGHAQGTEAELVARIAHAASPQAPWR
ncbi:hypothetical protein HUN58_10765 [Curtobacterium sp. Csp1]|uniref:hypothetical protein n=1 Tax=Curtobacterium sp. Csp1 TaxID=2495429 RepID=UPI001598501A|nr:hypothetical protein [Curtobacterium sp. Csp1]QKS20358.1 hypothetical protein HUN58_10765 [Curtobacterium sp. Csp1]